MLPFGGTSPGGVGSLLDHLKKTFKHTIIYGLGGLISKAVGFLLIPVYTRYLSPNDYGLVAMVMIYITVLEIVMRMGVDSALFKVYFEEENEESRRTLVTTTFLFQLVAAGAVFALTYPFSDGLSDLFFGSKDYTVYFQYAAASQVLVMLRVVPLSVIRAQERPGVFSILNVVRFALVMGFNILFVVVLEAGPLGIIQAQFYAALVLIPVFLVITFRHIRLRLSWRLLKRLTSFGLPLVPAGLAGWVLTMADRWILRLVAPVNKFALVVQKGLGTMVTKTGDALAGALPTLVDVGLYDLAYKFSLIVRMGLIQPFIFAWGPLMFSVFHQPEAKQVYRAVLTLFTLASVGLCFAVGVMAPEIVKLMATWPFYSAWSSVFILGLSHCFYGLYIVFTVGTSVVHKSKYQAYTSTAGVVANVGLNFLLIPLWGVTGAALATLLSFGVMAVVHYHFSQREYRIDYDLGAVVKVLVLATALWVGTTFLPFGWWGTVGRVGALGLFVLLLKVFGLFRAEEVKLVWGGFKDFIARRRGKREEPPPDELGGLQG
jgi:O-antigen/teichoic acid export membrane protein